VLPIQPDLPRRKQIGFPCDKIVSESRLTHKIQEIRSFISLRRREALLNVAGSASKSFLTGLLYINPATDRKSS
jgi:hypothetical protein